MRSGTTNELLELFILKLEHAAGQTGLGAWLRARRKKKQQLKPLYVFVTAQNNLSRRG